MTVKGALSSFLDDDDDDDDDDHTNKAKHLYGIKSRRISKTSL